MGAACTKGVKGGATVSPIPAERAAEQRALSLQHVPPAGHKSRRRGSVSAEPSGGSSLPHQLVGKPATSTQKIRELVRSTLLFKELDEEQEACIIDAMFERRVPAGQVVIREGEEADNFYVIESGSFAATKKALGDGASGRIQVATYEGQGSFGELALMYNCPRAATVTALTEGVLWGVDRATFRSLVVRSMEERRQRYEAALRRMPILQHLMPGQLAAVADCLHQETFEVGEYIVWEGAPLDKSAKFYMIESGAVDCFRTFEGKKKAVKSLAAGDMFGEVALLTKAPRQADCVAASRCKCLTMSRDAFERLMGPAEETLSQQIAQYARSNKEYEEASEKDGGIAAIDQEREAVAEEEIAAEAVAPAAEMDNYEGGAATAAAAGEDSPEAGANAAAGARCERAAAAVTLPSVAAASSTTAATTAVRAGTPLPGSAPGSPSLVGVMALLPGSPRPPLRLSDNSFSQRRSGRSTSARSTVSSEMEPASTGGSPTVLLSQLQQQHQPAHDGGAGTCSAAPREGAAGAEAGTEAPAVCLLPPIAEEPAEAAAVQIIP